MLTIEGLRMLKEMRSQGKDLPEDWPEEARQYIKNKRKIAESFHRPWDRQQLAEAESIVRFLYEWRG